MLPGVGIFGSEPISTILIDFLKHFDFEIHGIWSNHYEVESGANISDDPNISIPAEIVTTKIDNVLLNKNVNLVFVCCQPNFHSQISSKALGIGKNVICLSPTCKDMNQITHMINSARYYPSLISSISYGGLKFLPEFSLLKESLPLIGDIKFCNIIINCQNLAVIRHEKSAQTFTSSANTSAQALNWLTDSDLGAGVLNRFGASMVSFVLNLFEDKRVTKVFGTLRTFIEDLNNTNVSLKASPDDYPEKITRKITSDDHCSFQMCLEPSSIIVNVVINSLAQCKYSQEIVVCGSEAALVWKNSSITLRSTQNIKSIQLKDLIKKNTPPTSPQVASDNSPFSEFQSIETNLALGLKKSPHDIIAENYLAKYKYFEHKHPEMPFIFIRGLYSYISQLKDRFQIEVSPFSQSFNDSKNVSLNKSMTNLSDSTKSLPSVYSDTNSVFEDLESFEHTRMVQTIVNQVATSSELKRWVAVNY